MNASARAARRNLRDRRRADTKHSISTYVRTTTTDDTTIDGATDALRKVAAKLRTNGTLGKVQMRDRKIVINAAGDTHTERTYRYTRAQIQRIAATYRPRKAEYKTVAASLRLAA